MMQALDLSKWAPLSGEGRSSCRSGHCSGVYFGHTQSKRLAEHFSGESNMIQLCCSFRISYILISLYYQILSVLSTFIYTEE